MVPGFLLYNHHHHHASSRVIQTATEGSGDGLADQDGKRMFARASGCGYGSLLPAPELLCSDGVSAFSALSDVMDETCDRLPFPPHQRKAWMASHFSNLQVIPSKHGRRKENAVFFRLVDETRPQLSLWVPEPSGHGLNYPQLTNRKHQASSFAVPRPKLRSWWKWKMPAHPFARRGLGFVLPQIEEVSIVPRPPPEPMDLDEKEANSDMPSFLADPKRLRFRCSFRF